MKGLFTLILVLIISVLSAQNWSPILVNEKMNYKHSDSNYISHTIWVDSAFATESDSVYYLNRIVKDVPGNPEIALRNQPQFLMEFMVKQIYGIYSFHYPYDYFLSTNLPVGASWTFDLTNNIEAEITAYIVEEIFGIMDSVEVISLSDGNEIRLSKNFGILKFPDFENGGYFELVGIQNTAYGESFPDFWDIYNFEVGDVFQYYIEQASTDPNIEDHITSKITINVKEINNNSYFYSYNEIYYRISYYTGGPLDTSIYIFSDTIIFIDSLDHPANISPNQIYFLHDSYSGYGTGRVLTLPNIYIDQDTDVLYKEYGIKEPGYCNWPDNVFYEFDIYCDTIYKYEFISLIDYPAFLKGIGYGSSLGEVFSNEGFFEYFKVKKLEGYIKEGDTVGTITPDSLLLVGVESQKYKKSGNFVIYPNPVDEWLNIRQKNLYYAYNYNIEIWNQYGQLVREEKNIQSLHYTMNIAELKAGVYFYMIREKGEIIQQGKLIIK
ncbi:MAG: T9SS type A sorting domain-containing protein [Bacteroidales bacterium]|nr:T9SS type A sorting domain-containing protein [Bacteroidales bacterium]